MKQDLSEMPTDNNGSAAKLMIVEDSITKPVGSLAELELRGYSGDEPNESIVISSRRNMLPFEISSRNDEYTTRTECRTVSSSDGMRRSTGGRTQKTKVGTLFPRTIPNGDGENHELEQGLSSSVRKTLRFEVSKNTGRVHLYSCIRGKDSRPRPLFVNFRLEEAEFNSLEAVNRETTDNSVNHPPIYGEALMAFITEWKELRPIDKRKLIGKPLQLPLSYELCYLNESLNHDNRGILNGGSKRRKTPKDEISFPLPPNAARRKVNLYGGRGEKEKLYSQGWSDMDEPLCKLCQAPCKQNTAKVPQFFEDLFCSLDCFEEYRSRTSNKYLREELFKIERGICTNCGLDCHQLVEHLRPLSVELRQAYVKKKAPNIAERKKLLAKLVQDPAEGNAWHADHIVPVYNGGGECKLENMRTLCVACHGDVTTAQCAERRIARKKAKEQLKDIMSGLANLPKSKPSDNVLQENEDQDDDLLIHVPGSAYSRSCFNETEETTDKQKLMANPNSNNFGSGVGEARPQEQEDPNIPACISNNETSEVMDEAGKEQEVVSMKAEYCEHDKKDGGRNTSGVSLYSEFKMLLGNAL